MTRETRANLLFLAIILAISLPGAIILFRKKLDPQARISYLPDPVRQSVPYIDPNPMPGTRRIVPQQTGQWVAQLIGQRLGPDVRPLQDPDNPQLPLLSDRRLFQLVRIQPGTPARLEIIVWQPSALADPPVLTVRADGQTSSARVAVADIPVPDAIYRELRSEGMIRPPRQIRWLSATLERPIELKQATIELAGVEGNSYDFVTIFTNHLEQTK